MKTLANRLMMLQMLKSGGGGADIPYPTDGLRFYFSFDNIDGNTVINEVDGESDGVMLGGSLNTDKAIVNNGAVFSGSNSVKVFNDQKNDEFTISFWIKPIASDNGKYIVGQLNPWANGWSFAQKWGRDIIFKFGNDRSGFLEVNYVAYDNASFNHVLVRKLTNKVEFYKNAILKESKSTTKEHYSKATEISIGSTSTTGEEIHKPCKSSIDEFLFYDRAITEEEIQQLYEYRG